MVIVKKLKKIRRINVNKRVADTGMLQIEKAQ
jgi:hypothetical protein